MTYPTAMMNDDLGDCLRQIGLTTTADNLADFLARAIKAQWSPTTVLENMAQAEAKEKARRSVESRLKRARLGKFKTMSEFDWNWPTKIDREIIERALTLDFIKESRNLILIGTNGLGKTMITKNIAYQAALAGHSVLFTTAAEILDALQGLSPEAFRRRIARYARPALLCVDEVGYLAYDSHASDLLYKVIDKRYEHRSVAITTNLAFKNWNTVFPNATSIATLLDKLTHHADITLMEGESYRVHESKKEAAARKKKKR
jgi:DNA replication protein DnaC